MTSRIESVDYAHDIRPYLQLPHLLSLTWLAYPILSLVFVVFRLQLSSGSAQDAVANAKEDLLASCKAAAAAALVFLTVSGLPPECLLPTRRAKLLQPNVVGAAGASSLFIASPEAGILLCVVKDQVH